MNIQEIFKKFVNICYINYGIGDIEIYNNLDLRNADQNCLNPYLKTEDDLKVKFGGFLEIELLNTHSDLTVHSELYIYNKTKDRADLSIHKVSKHNLWFKNEDILQSLVAAIEIKYENYCDQHYSYNMGHIHNDINKLCTLEKNIEKYMIIFDEGLKIDKNVASKILNIAKDNNVVILSNNEFF